MTDSGVPPDDAKLPLILTIDIGTSSSRALVFDRDSRAVDGWESHRPYEVDTTPDGGVTLDPDFVLDVTARCIDDTLKLISDRVSDIAAVACDTFWHSLLGVNGDGQAVTPVLTWADVRSSVQALALRTRLNPAEVHARTGAELHPSYLPAKLLWLKSQMPDEFGRAAYWMSLGEYVYWKLFGRRSVSISMASGTGLFDQHACRYDAAMLDVLPISVDQLSPICEYSEAGRALVDPYAERWPRLNHLPWFLPVGDGAANNIGSGGVTESEAVAMIGTSGAVRVVREVQEFSIPEGLWSYRVDGRRIVQGGALSSGGNVWAWITSILNVKDVETFERRLGDLEPDSHGLTVLPFLAGERSPRWNPAARSAMVGATLGTTDAEIVRAFLESTSYEFGLVFEILKQGLPEVRSIIGSGTGLVHSPTWMQILTDVLGTPVTICAAKEATSRGAAILALMALGQIRTLTDVPVPLGRTYRPNAEHHRRYMNAVERQQALYDLLAGSNSDAAERAGARRRLAKE